MTEETSIGEISLLTVLAQVYNLVLSCADLHGAGITKSQFLIFAALAYRKRLRMTQVAAFLSSSKEQATRAVAGLVDEGYVIRQQDPENRTIVYIVLSEQGRTLLHQWRLNLRQRLAARLEERLTGEEREELIGDIQSMLRILDKVV